jgi:hypothetical protein
LIEGRKVSCDVPKPILMSQYSFYETHGKIILEQPPRIRRSVDFTAPGMRIDAGRVLHA